MTKMNKIKCICHYKEIVIQKEFIGTNICISYCKGCLGNYR